MANETQTNPLQPSRHATDDPLSLHTALSVAVSTAVKTAIDRSKVVGFDMNKAASTASKCATIDFYYARLKETYEATANKYPMAAPHLEAPIACFDRALHKDIAPSDAFASAIACIKAITKIYKSAAEAAKAISDTNAAITAKATKALKAIAAAKASAEADKTTAEAAAKDPSVQNAATETQEAVQKLLVKGASHDAQNSQGQTAWDIARDGHHADTLKILEEHRSTLRSADHDTTPPNTPPFPIAPTPEDAAVRCAGEDYFAPDKAI